MDSNERSQRLGKSIMAGRGVPDFYPGSYSLAYPDKREIWDAIRNHPLFVDAVIASLHDIHNQIDRIRGYESDFPYGIKPALESAVQGFKDYTRTAKEIAQDTGFTGDWQDIIISLQRHPLIHEMLQERERLQKRRDNFQTLD